MKKLLLPLRIGEVIYKDFILNKLTLYTKFRSTEYLIPEYIGNNI